MDPGLALFQALLIGQSAVGLIAGLLLIRRFGMPGLVGLGFALAGLGLAMGAVVVRNGFAVLGFWFGAMVWILAPLAVCLGAVHLKRRRTWSGVALVAIGTIVGATAWYATRVEPFRLQVAKHKIESDRIRTESIVVAVLSDIQTDEITDYEWAVFERVDALAPDLILLPGDYIQCRTEEAFKREQRKLAELFNGFHHKPRLGILGVDGDVDSARESLRGTVARSLSNEVVRFEEDGLQVLGLTTSTSRHGMTAPVREALEDFDGLTLIFGHAPEYMKAALDGSFSEEAVLVAGHTHGGQIVIPFFGPPVTLANVPRWLAAGGLHRHGAAHLIVSRGIGMERGYAPRVRLFCPPEIVVLTLKRYRAPPVGRGSDSGRRRSAWK